MIANMFEFHSPRRVLISLAAPKHVLRNREKTERTRIYFFEMIENLPFFLSNLSASTFSTAFPKR